jgi:hypothetical protein
MHMHTHTDTHSSVVFWAITSVIVEKKNDVGQVIPDQWTLSSFAAFRRQ